MFAMEWKSTSESNRPKLMESERCIKRERICMAYMGVEKRARTLCITQLAHMDDDIKYLILETVISNALTLKLNENYANRHVYAVTRASAKSIEKAKNYDVTEWHFMQTSITLVPQTNTHSIAITTFPSTLPQFNHNKLNGTKSNTDKFHWNPFIFALRPIGPDKVTHLNCFCQRESTITGIFLWLKTINFKLFHFACIFKMYSLIFNNDDCLIDDVHS